MTRIDSIHISDANNLNAPFPSIESKEFIRNVIGLAYDYQRRLIFYSDIQRGSINSVYFNGTRHKVKRYYVYLNGITCVMQDFLFLFPS